jgi:hypothetical protein
MHTVKAIMFSIETMADRSNRACTEVPVRQLCSSITPLRGSGLEIAVMITRCTLRIQLIAELSPLPVGIVAAMDHRHPWNRFGNSGVWSRVHPFDTWGRSVE